MSLYNIVATTDESTVVAEYVPAYSRSDTYQSEAALEKEMITLLQSQGYEYLVLHDQAALVANLRKQLELLNQYSFSDNEWKRFFTEKIASANEGIVEKTRKIQEDYVQNLLRDDGSTKNIYLIDKKNIHNNRLHVINQYEESDGTHEARYDVTILVNGLPLVHVELKRRGVAIREAFNQINRYQRDSFWASSGLYEYVQIFIISNGTYTKYYSNTTRDSHIRELGEGERRRSKKTSNSFEFTSYWADAKNKTIADLVDFTKTFLSKHTLLNILTKYCVFTTENLLLVLRPYQIAATEKILSKIQIAHNYKQMGSIKGGGFVWHTTGSGKTLTSFKTAQLATALPFIDKVLFVVDRKDLDYQTMKEYDRFQKGAANSNSSTRILQRQLEDSESRIIITTIQKLSVFIKNNKGHEVFQKRIVIVFDECHRSQFGDMHKTITKSFKKYNLFGFTGTPIFGENSPSGGNPLMKTTEQAFGDKLHTYTIVDAINDGNVLPFHIDFINTMRMKDSLPDIDVAGINTEEALRDPSRIKEIVKYVLEHFDQKTKRSSFYSLKGQRIAGFNSIFAASSIPMAKLYYNEFKRQIDEGTKKLTIATIFSFSPNEAEPDDILPEEDFNTATLDQPSREFLESAISDYNAMFSVNFDTSSEKFENYYKDISMRVKNREIDLLIVVNMFLTGFDATTLNTLWVDKNLRHHGLIQAFSRTNRILNSVKTFGNIVCFRNLQKETDEAIALFGDKDAGSIVLLRRYEDYYYGYESEDNHTPGYIDLINDLLHQFPLGQPIQGEQSQKEFIALYSSILRLKNILTAFDSFEGNEMLPERDFQDYQSTYIDLYQEFGKKKTVEKEKINDDIVFEIELVRQVEINIDYILMLVERYHQENCKDKEILVSIDKAINSSIQLRSKKDLIEAFIQKVNVAANVRDEWQHYVEDQKNAELETIINEENLKPEAARRFVDNSFRDGSLRTTGTDIDKIMPPLSRFGSGNRGVKKQTVIQKLTQFFEKFFGLISY
jgi:type I restriction enzyme R subunit